MFWLMELENWDRDVHKFFQYKDNHRFQRLLARPTHPNKYELLQ